MFKYLAAAPLLLLTSCNSLFYHPDGAARMTPAIANVPFDELTVPTPDGERLHAWRLRPTGRAKGVVVQFHGNAENMTSHFRSVYWLAARGYYVVTFDYRGYGASSGEPSREGLVRDGAAILAYVARDVDLKDLDLFVIAQSLGGAVAVPAIAEARPAHLRALVLESTFSSYRAIARRKLGQAWLTWPFQYPLSLLVSDEWSPIDYIAKIEAPVLFIRGDADHIVPPDQDEALTENVLPEKKEEWIVKGGNHTPAFREIEGPYEEKLVNYMARYRNARAVSQIFH